MESRSHRLRAAALALIAALTPFGATAGDGELELQSRLDLGVGSIDEDGFVLVLGEQSLDYRGFGIVLAAPLRFRVVDRAPRDGLGIRGQDWDDPSDWARIVPAVTLFHEGEDGGVDLRLGELEGVGIGHGAVVDAYFNTLDMDRYQGGALLKGEWLGNGLELMLEDVVEPDIIVGRAFVSPLAWFLDGDWPRRLELGYTLGADIGAPYRLQQDRGDRAFLVTGGDISLRIIDEAWGALMPYVDLLGMDGELGVHAGIASTWTFSERKEIRLHLRGEYRRVGSDYHPAVFNPFYERHRLYYGRDPDSGDPISFADHLASSEEPVRHAGMFDLAFTVGRTLRLGARYDAEGAGRPHWVMFRFDLSPMEQLAIGAFYAGEDLDGGPGVFSRDALIGTAVSWRIWKPFSAFAEFSRRWRGRDGEMIWANDSAVGIGLTVAY